MIRLGTMLSVGIALAGCGSEVATDGSPEARRVADWLSSGAGDAVAPGAVLVMSDYSEPLTPANMRRSGPDRIAGCALARVDRSRTGATAIWSCPASVDPLHRRVEFDMAGGRIRAARYIEAVQAHIP